MHRLYRKGIQGDEERFEGEKPEGRRTRNEEEEEEEEVVVVVRVVEVEVVYR